MNSGENSDHAQNPGPMSGLQVQWRVAYVENLSYIINSSCLHGPENHVRSRAPILDIITADVSRKRFFPTCGTQYAISH